MATLGTRTAVADCDEGGPGFVNLIVRTITIARQVGMRLRSECTGTHRHARINQREQHNRERRADRDMGSRAMEEQLKEHQLEFGMREQKREAEDAKRIRGIVHEHNKNKRGPGFVNVCVRTTQDELGCGCKANARGRTDALGVTRATQPRRENEPERWCATSLKRLRNS